MLRLRAMLLLRGGPQEAPGHEDEAIVTLRFGGFERLVQHALNVFAQRRLTPTETGCFLRVGGFAVTRGVEQRIGRCGGVGRFIALRQGEAALRLLGVVSDEGS